MRAAIYQSAGEALRADQVPDPAPANDEVVLQVAKAGICGSDLHVKQQGLATPGTIFGHEFAGTVVARGSEAGSWTAGERVTALPIFPCRHCEACDAGLTALCPSVAFVGIGPKRGAYAEFISVRADQLQRLPQGVDFTQGAMVEPLAVAHHAVDMAEIRSGDAVLITGGGPIGMGATLFARLAGARHVILSEPANDRRERAMALGATGVIDPKTENVAARFAEMTGHAPDVVLECVGVPGLLAQAVEHVRLRGRVVVVGVCFGEDKFTPVVALAKEITIRFSQCYTESDFAAVIDAIATGRVEVGGIHTRTVSFTELPAIFEELGSDPRECKVLLDPALA